MIYLLGKGFPDVIRELRSLLRESPQVPQIRWQGVDVSNNPAARCYELQNVVFEVDLGGVEDLAYWQKEIGPNLPWADNHFKERVSGKPLNPGREWQNWPWGKSADRFRGPDEQFNHTYPERLWPKYARMTDKGQLPVVGGRGILSGQDPRKGIAWQYGDLIDLVELLVKDPYTRQAYIPLFFPEDTGWADGGRKVCTLGYQFLRRGDSLSIWYPMRSCDFVRHFRDDCYLAVRLLLWVLNHCRGIDYENWGQVKPGLYSMWMTSLHIFEVDRRNL